MGAGGEFGTLRSRLARWAVALECRIPVPVGLGLRLLRLPMGLTKPLPGRKPRSYAGVTTAIWSSSMGNAEVSTAAAVSKTEGTLCSSCSVVFERGMRWGL